MHAESGTSPAVSLPLSVDLRHLPWIRRLAADYTYNFAALAPFFSGDPVSHDAWANAIVRAQGHARSRDRIAAAVGDQQQRRQAPPEARRAAERLADARTVAVVTGQQAGLFGGPLFTLLKALTALQLAAQVTEQHGVPAVAVFWIDAEDHDWDEVSACHVLDGDLRLRAISLPRPEGAGEVPVASIKLAPSIGPAIEELANALVPTEFTAPLLGRLREAYRVGAGMAEAFGGWLEAVLGPRGLVVLDSSDPALKPFAGAVFARELQVPGETARLAAVAGVELLGRGYHAQASPHDHSVALFHLEGVRIPIRYQADGFTIGDTSVTASALMKEVATRPTAFSPNVLLRPIVQDALLPTVCYVAGPNELGYLAQLRRVYDHFGVPMPLIYPRATATLVDSSAARFLTKYKLPIEALQPQDEAALNRLLATRLPATVERAFEEADEAVAQRMAVLIAAVPAIDSTLEGAARATLARMQQHLETLRAKLIHAAKRRDDTLRRQFMHARAQAFPNGHPQERALGFVHFLNQYGPALVDRLAERLPLEMGRHWVVTI